MKLRCLFGHDWGNEENVRQDIVNPVLAIFFPLLWIYIFTGPHFICDKKCKRCGKVREFYKL